MVFELNGNFNELSLSEMQAIDGGGFYEIFMRGAEILFVGTCIAVGAGGGVLGAAVVVAVTGGSKEQVSNCLGAGFISGVTYGAFSGATV